MSRILKPLLLLISFALSGMSQVRAAQLACVGALASLVGGNYHVENDRDERVAPGYGNRVTFESYAAFHDLLFLSDGKSPDSLARRVAKKFPDKKVISSDVFYSAEQKFGNLTELPMDNSEPFPFADNSFDAIVMRRGLCFCNGFRACGGINVNKNSMKKFLSEVVRVLNKHYLHSQAFLHGREKDAAIKNLWLEIAHEIEATQKVEIKILQDEQDNFNSILIRPGQS